MKLIRHIPPFIYNKYFLASSLFAVWMLFFDRNDLFTQLNRKNDLRQIEQSKEYFANKIAEGKKFSVDMRSNTGAVEKFVREKYLMKRDNEDLFLIQKLEKE
jgi:cell division protein DivIC